MSISNVSSQHAGVYWCGVKSDKGHYRAGLGRIQLAVNDIPILTKSTTIGQNLTYWYQYPKGTYKTIFICKGEDPSTCDTLADTLPPNKATPNTGRFFITDGRVNRNITITVVNVRREDTGTYWCGGESINPKKNISFHKLQMTVVWSPAGGSLLTVTIPVVICVAVLLLMLVLLYMGFQRKKNTRNGKAQNKEDRPYEEIQELPQKPGSGTALKSIYVTANAPTSPPPSHYYSSISFHKSSGEASGDTYSTVKDNIQCPTYSTVNHPSRLPEDPFYSTVNRPQQH
ncbi:uncharacterized protein LOC121951842 isoform X2 [Plectropomus leopardus]|nr:uncharacterized protein LOC121951842 isoform X2 [Plectropomus leopardus]XP_042354278.1 uncharacterized protein LOC121951842 isoform X2 [Plectropomus leopardus]